MDWFEALTGFREAGYEATGRQLELTAGRLRSRVNGGSWGVGTLELPSLQQLRRQAPAADPAEARLAFRNVTGDVRALHRQAAFGGALFQVASQFNMLEMTGPDVTPEHGVTRYQHDRTQGPACAIAAGAATVFRNYFAPVDGQQGQTATRQLDGLAELGAALAERLAMPVRALWTMRNGYALASPDGLAAIGAHLGRITEDERDTLRALLRIGLHADVEVTEGDRPQTVSQAFCSALPVAYSGIGAAAWRPLATLVLEAAYEATLLSAAARAASGGSRIVLLTQLGGGAFGNDPAWIEAAIDRALTLCRHHALDVRLVSYGAVPPAMTALEQRHRS